MSSLNLRTMPPAGTVGQVNRNEADRTKASEADLVYGHVRVRHPAGTARGAAYEGKVHRLHWQLH